MDFHATQKSLPALPPEQQVKATIFTMKGWKPDTKMTILGKEFQVHSMVLRLYSAFFRHALEEIDAHAGGSAGSQFRYEFEAVTWNSGTVSEQGEEVNFTFQKAVEKPHTPCASPTFPPADLCLSAEQEKTSPDDRSIVALTNLLRAFYNKPYSLTSVASLASLVHLATRMGALPCLSSSLYVVLWGSPRFLSSIREQPERVLLLAFRLRHALLFREALVHVVARWKGWHAVFDGEHRLICAIVKARNRILEKIVSVNNCAFEFLRGSEDGEKEEFVKVLRKEGALIGSRRFYESFLVGKCDDGRVFANMLRSLLKCNLVLEAYTVGAKREDEFMCAQIEDQDLPWDLDEEDW